ncbi:unnamed protein product [Calypogeia fissa]
MGKSTRGPAAKPGPPTQLLLIELKHRILGALHKLADRDTQQIAVDDLERIVLTLSPEGISLCLNCLYDTDAQQKSVVRKECVRLLGTLATVHGDLLIPHMSKIVTTVVRRLKDTDSNVRDACVETMGVLASEVPGAGGEAGPLNVYVKPLFDAMSEQNRSLQMGAGLCLARVIECLKDPQPVLLQKLCPRLVKFFGSNSFQAKPALLSAIGSLFQAAGAGAAQFLPTLIPLAQEALESSDWTTRKAAADTLSRLASTLGPALFTFKKDSVEALESCRFDKVKPVRDSVAEALQQWRAIVESDGDHFTPTRNAKGVFQSPGHHQSSTPSNGDVENPRTGDKTIVHSRSANNVSGMEGSRNSSGGAHSRPSSNSPPNGSTTKRKTPALSDKKINPDFFRKLEVKGPDDWPVEIAVTRGSDPPAAESPGKLSDEAEEVKVDIVRSGDGSGNGAIRNFSSDGLEIGGLKPGRSGSGETRESLVWRRGEFTSTHPRRGSKPGIGSYDGKGLGGNVNVINNPISEMLESNPWMEAKDRDAESWESSGQALSPSSSATYEDDGPAISSMDEWTSVQKQLQLLEFQQRNHLKMFQEFMADVHQSMLEMDLRVRGLERVISAARDVPASVNRIINGGATGFEPPAVRSLSKFLASSQSLSEKLRKAASASRAAFSDRQPGFGLGADIRSGRSSPWKHDSDPEYDSPYSSAHRAGSAGSNLGVSAFGSQRVDISPSAISSLRGEHEVGEKVSTRHGWEKSAGPAPFGDNHIVRNVWQASKDEATLEAIRGAPVAIDDSRTGVGAKKSSTNAIRISSENILEGKETFWMLWSRAMDYIRAGDMDAAYVDVMASGDEMLLIRLMSHTGPVLNKLASGTALEMLHTAIQLLQQQSFLDSVLPWVHQVADLIATKGPEFLGLSPDGKRDLVTCLQDSASMEFPEGWMASSVADVAAQLCTAWSIDL